MKFDYYYQDQVKQFQFIMIPRAMFGSKEFEELSYAAKLLYGLLRDRCTMSAKNDWVDEKGRVYIIFTIEDIAAELTTSQKMSVQYLNELVEFGLVEKKRRGLGLPNLLYIKNFVIEEDEHVGNDDEGKNKNGKIVNSRLSQKVNSGVEDSLISDFTDVSRNNTDTNQNNNNQPTIPDNSGWVERHNMMRNIVDNHIDTQELIDAHEADERLIVSIRDLIAEVLMMSDGTVVIAKQEVPVAEVKSKFLMIKAEHVEYVIDWIKKHPVEMKNPRKYLMTLLYNSFTTMEPYYAAEFARNFAS